MLGLGGDRVLGCRNPLQMAAAYAAIGNDGIWTAPHIVASTTDVDGNQDVAGLETR